jgi:pimeloyl-ACP methyl ester carboxylesterase
MSWRPGPWLTRPATCLAFAALLATHHAPARGAARMLGSLELAPCTLSARGWPVSVAAQCGTLAVPEDRDRRDGRRIELAIALVPSTAKRPRPDPVVLLAGGPGQSALDAYPGVAAAFSRLLRQRDVVLVDQRGTGRSHPLRCPGGDEGVESRSDAAVDPDSARRQAERCLAALDADPRFYTTAEAVRDLEDVRNAIGVPQLDLVAVSYGTRVALEYLRRHPDRVRAAVLDGVVPPGLALGSGDARNLEASVNAQFALCEQDAACAGRYGAPREALDRLLGELRERPQPVRYRDPLTDELREDPLTTDTLAGLVRLYAYVPQLAAMLPRTLAEAAAGRPDLLMAQARMVETLVGEQVNDALQLSVICSEDADRLEVDPRDARTLMGTRHIETLLAQCEVWPRGHRPADFDTPVRSDRPVLLLSGEFDPVTPPAYGERVLRDLANGRHLVARGQGHDVLAAGCMPRLVAAFVESADAVHLDARCLERLGATPPFAGAYGWEP